MPENAAAPLRRFPIHLGPGSLATVQPAFDGDVSWYADYAERVAADGEDGWLVSQGTFTEPWDSWERHPHGHEIVICIGGSLTLVQEHADGSTDEILLSTGDAAINPPGTWHTADCDEPATAIFVTSGRGTDHRPR